eukprot:6240845-Prymnesium_polylepis.1
MTVPPSAPATSLTSCASRSPGRPRHSRSGPTRRPASSSPRRCRRASSSRKEAVAVSDTCDEPSWLLGPGFGGRRGQVPSYVLSDSFTDRLHMSAIIDVVCDVKLNLE